MILLETQRLIVRATSLNDLDNMCALYSDPDVMKYYGRGPKLRKEVQSFAHRVIQHQEKHGFSSGNVYEKISGSFIGRSGLVYVELNDNQPNIDLGYVLHKLYWNKGYATELAKGFLEWGFKNLSIDKILGNVHPENLPSIHVLKKVGMKYVRDSYCYDIAVAEYAIWK